MPPPLRTQDDEKYRDVEVSAVQEVEVVPGPELDVGAEPHDDEAGQREQEVEDEDDVLDAGVATRVHGAAGAGTLLHCSTVPSVSGLHLICRQLWFVRQTEVTRHEKCVTGPGEMWK